MEMGMGWRGWRGWRPGDAKDLLLLIPFNGREKRRKVWDEDGG